MHLGLIVNELVTNACKYAYPDRAGGQVWVRVAQEVDAVQISVRDGGVGLPHNYTAESSNGLGMRIVRSLASQLGASLATNRGTSGAEFIVVVPQK